jgi:hypothetical protein
MFLRRVTSSISTSSGRNFNSCARTTGLGLQYEKPDKGKQGAQRRDSTAGDLDAGVLAGDHVAQG